MFSQAFEIVLTIAHREATSRRHAHLTLEHLLYALAHDPDGEAILGACGADLPRLRRGARQYLKEQVEQFPRGREKDPAQTLAFRRALQTAVLHVQSAGRSEVRAGDVLAAALQETQVVRGAGAARSGRHAARHPELHLARHPEGAAEPPSSPHGEPDEQVQTPAGDDVPAVARDPLAAYAVNLSERAAGGLLDPLIGRQKELQRTMEILCRRRKNGPVFVGDAGVGKTAMAEGLAQRLLQPDVPEALTGAEVFSLDTSALLAGTRFRGDFEERFKAVLGALGKRRNPILFIDELHSIIGAGATTGGTMDLATLLKPVLTSGGLRVMGSTTFDEFKQIEKDRALSRRFQKVPLQEPTVEETVKHPAGAAETIRRTPPRRCTRRRPSRRRRTGGTAPARLPVAGSAPSTCWMKPAPWCACRPLPSPFALSPLTPFVLSLSKDQRNLLPWPWTNNT